MSIFEVGDAFGGVLGHQAYAKAGSFVVENGNIKPKTPAPASLLNSKDRVVIDDFTDTRLDATVRIPGGGRAKRRTLVGAGTISAVATPVYVKHARYQDACGAVLPIKHAAIDKIVPSGTYSLNNMRLLVHGLNYLKSTWHGDTAIIAYLVKHAGLVDEAALLARFAPA